jgi:hypothetical protein
MEVAEKFCKVLATPTGNRQEKNNENGLPSVSFFILFFHKASLCNCCDACLYCFSFAEPSSFKRLVSLTYNFQKFLCMQLKFGGRGGLKLPLCRRRALCFRWRALGERRAAPHCPPTLSPADIEHPRYGTVQVVFVLSI